MAIAGAGGNVKTGANTIGEVEQWKLDINAETLETTNFGSGGWKEFIAGLKDWAGSFDASWNVANDATGQKAVQDSLLAGTSMTIEFDIDQTHHYTGTVIVKKASITSAVKDLVKIAYDVQGTGAITYA